jgi:trehalose transport system permease protein
LTPSEPARAVPVDGASTPGASGRAPAALPPTHLWKWSTVGLYAAVVVISLFMLFPIYVIFLLAFVPVNHTIFAAYPSLIPPSLTTSNLVSGLTTANLPFLPAMYFSLEIAFLVGAIALLIGIPTAYGLSRLPKKLAYGLTTVMFIVNMLPSITIAIPIGVQFLKVPGFYGSALAIALAQELLALPVTVFLLVGAFQSLPRDLENQARVDGAGRAYAIFGNLVPLIVPALVASFLLAWMLSWDESTFALILANLAHAPLAVDIFLAATGRGEVLAAVAFSFVATVPVIILVVILQKYLKGEDLAVGVRG